MHNSLDLVVLVLVFVTACAIDTLGPVMRAKAPKAASAAPDQATAEAPKRSLRHGIAAAVAVGVLVQFSSAVGLVRMVSLN